MTMELTVVDTRDIDVKAEACVSEARAIVVRSEPTYLKAVDFLKGLKRIQGMIDDTFDAPIKAAHDAHKSIVAAKKKHSEPVAEAERLIKAKVGTWAQEQERVRREAEEKARKEQERLEAEARKKNLPPPMPVVAPVIRDKAPKIDGVSMRKAWKFEVTNSDAVPRELCIPDERRIRERVNALGESANIPGVRCWQENVVSASGKL